MTFSIIIPAYNAEKRLWKLLESIRRQTFTDYEVIVVCDSCKDNTAAVARGYGCKVFEIDEHNDGAARSKGLDEATGKFVMFADDDDWWINDYALEQIVMEMSALKDIPDIIQCSFVFGYNGVTETMNGRVWPNVWSKIWKREAIGDTRFPKVYPDSDLKFTNEMIGKGCSVMCWPVLWYYYNYLRVGSISWKLEREKMLKSET
jgi:glycosyltransferase involved in cell wall biosynthesis